MKLLLYCTKSKPYLFKKYGQKKFFLFDRAWEDTIQYTLNGKIVAECDFEVEKIKGQSWQSDANRWYSSELLEKSCLHVFEIDNYLKGKEGYAIHIKNLKIFDKPYELNDCVKPYNQIALNENRLCPINKAPQNMQKVWFWKDYEEAYEDYALISIRPKWLCKILNGEKTIEVRKKVLKEMIK